jgi:hypothetical protein
VDIVRWLHSQWEFRPPIFKLKGNSGQSTHRHNGHREFQFQLDDFHKIDVMGLAADYPNDGGSAPPPIILFRFCYFSPHFCPSGGKNVRLFRAVAPASDAREVEIGESPNVLWIGKGSELNPSRYAPLACAGATDLVFRMSSRYPREMIVGPNTARELIFDTPAVRFRRQGLDSQAYAFFPYHVVANADEGIYACDASTKRVIDGTNCSVIQEKLEMPRACVVQEDLQIAPRRAADSFFGIVEPTVFESTSICVGALRSSIERMSAWSRSARHRSRYWFKRIPAASSGTIKTKPPSRYPSGRRIRLMLVLDTDECAAEGYGRQV